MLLAPEKTYSSNLEGSLSMKIIPEGSKHSINVSSGKKKSSAKKKYSRKELFPKRVSVICQPQKFMKSL